MGMGMGLRKSIAQIRRACGFIPLKNLDISFFFSELKYTNLFSSDCGQSGRAKKIWENKFQPKISLQNNLIKGLIDSCPLSVIINSCINKFFLCHHKLLTISTLVTLPISRMMRLQYMPLCAC
jgi:hypothetical protein